MVRGARHADAESKIDLPFRREIEVDGRKNLVLLLAEGEEAGYWAGRAVVFESTRDFFGEIVAELEVRRKDHALVDTCTVKGAAERGVEREIPASDLLVDDRADLPGPG